MSIEFGGFRIRLLVAVKVGEEGRVHLAGRAEPAALLLNLDKLPGPLVNSGAVRPSAVSASL